MAIDLAGLGQKLRRLREELGLSQKELAQKLGKSPATLNRWELGKAMPEGISLVLLARVLDVTVASLLHAAGLPLELEDALRVVPGSPPLHVVPRPPEGYTAHIPGFAYAEAGPGVQIGDMGYPLGGGEFFVDRLPTVKDPHAFALRARGKSMDPFVMEGWAIVLDSMKDAVKDELVVAKIADDTGDGYRVVVKQYGGRRRVDGKAVVWLRSSSRDAADLEVPPARILRLYKVVALIPPSEQKEPM